ncbi:iron ABC transporter permease [Vagococcus carniphilus]|uniref:Iron ABC transporter permease n=1 Tax=Vagococcus carniphilus TaxID=218144 RepID=A0AAW8U6M3_9ENTE|nr:iron ABC transporter permease [Vagococcus carniphilus]MDT2829354.1 iron ABC transporter permease [Vagococcus carniphilus]MDT2833439.1 iron ABC transporter permease [Vagococcus carniphilus]MDT2838813.1 iron ABC transporter permease [Vagococcus carniphilus]MDT2852871.1 iron ABC transporter permease [Vagococcus carniphilus]
MKRISKKFILINLLMICTVAVILLSLTFDLSINYSDIWQALTHFNPDSTEHVLIISRVSRVIVALLVGASLSLSGQVMQLQYQNDLADPSLMGISDGSALAISILMIFNPEAKMLERIIISLVGSLVIYLLLFIINQKMISQRDKLSLPLLGIILSLLISSVTTFIVTYFDIAQSVTAWYASRLYRVSLSDVIYFLPVLIIGIILLLILRKEMNVFSFGPEITTVIGMNRKLLNTLLSLVVVLLTGISVAIVGRMAFIGLVVPHMSKLLVGKRYGDTLLITPILGGFLVLVSDYLSRILNYPFETPISVVIAFLGVPIFLYLVRKGTNMRYD